MRNSRKSKLVLSAAILTAVLQTGCADLKAVRDYGALGKGVSASFTPLVEESGLRCREIFEYRALIGDGRRYDPMSAIETGKKACEKNSEASKPMLDLSSLMNDYHDGLIKIAGGDLSSSLSADYTGLGTAIKAVKIEGQAIAAPAAVDAINAVAAWLNKVLIAQRQAAEIKDALAQHERVAQIADLLVLYVERNYGGYLKDATEQTATSRKILEEKEDLDPLAANVVKREIYLRLESLRERQKAIAAYKAATDKMKKALAELAATDGKLDGKGQLQVLLELRKEVQDLYKKVTAAL
ncbi:MAG: hypothetical protein JNM76_16485 [Betaproteobacteria bacterium]|nr:hypothetical protein [Betaproteobacteria bacterium]